MDPVDSHASDIMRIISQTRAIEAETDAIKRGFAHILYERLMKEIAEYEAGLNADEEIGAFLSSFGSEIIIQIQDVRYRNPYFIVFEGINTNDGTRVSLSSTFRKSAYCSLPSRSEILSASHEGLDSQRHRNPMKYPRKRMGKILVNR